MNTIEKLLIKSKEQEKITIDTEFKKSLLEKIQHNDHVRTPYESLHFLKRFLISLLPMAVAFTLFFTIYREAQTPADLQHRENFSQSYENNSPETSPDFRANTGLQQNTEIPSYDNDTANLQPEGNSKVTDDVHLKNSTPSEGAGNMKADKMPEKMPSTMMMKSASGSTVTSAENGQEIYTLQAPANNQVNTVNDSTTSSEIAEQNIALAPLLNSQDLNKEGSPWKQYVLDNLVVLSTLAVLLSLGLFLVLGRKKEN